MRVPAARLELIEDDENGVVVRPHILRGRLDDLLRIILCRVRDVYWDPDVWALVPRDAGALERLERAVRLCGWGSPIIRKDR